MSPSADMMGASGELMAEVVAEDGRQIIPDDGLHVPSDL
jgi:hypothetical protein